MDDEPVRSGIEQTQASNYVLNADTLRWPAGKTVLTYAFNDQYFSDSDTVREGKLGPALSATDRQAVRDAIAEWERVCGVEFREVGDSPNADIRIGWMDSSESDGSGGMLAKTWIWSFGPGASKMAVGFDYREDWGTHGFYDAALHEFGHVLGIDDSDVEQVVMSGPPTSQDADQPGRDQLQPDDIAAAHQLWGPPDGPGGVIGGQGITLVGHQGEDTLVGTTGDDLIVGQDDDDLITGGFGADTIYGDDGNDTLSGNGEYWVHFDNPDHDYWSKTYNGYDDGDTIYGGYGDDSINGNAGTDSLEGGPGNDTILGGQNEGEWVAGTTRTNTTHLREGWDTLKGGSGNDYLNGNMGSDVLYGESGNDWMHGGQDGDSLYGGSGDDTLLGDLEGDWIDGGPGSDIIAAGNSPDRGDGAVDTISFTQSHSGTDTVYGFEDHDVVYIDGVRSTKTAAEALQHVFIPLTGG